MYQTFTYSGLHVWNSISAKILTDVLYNYVSKTMLNGVFKQVIYFNLDTRCKDYKDKDKNKDKDKDTGLFG